MLPQILLGAYVTFTRRDLYPIYSVCGRAFGGISPATDQYLGGLITWIPSSMMSVVAALIAMRNWIFRRRATASEGVQRATLAPGIRP